MGLLIKVLLQGKPRFNYKRFYWLVVQFLIVQTASNALAANSPLLELAADFHIESDSRVGSTGFKLLSAVNAEKGGRLYAHVPFSWIDSPDEGANNVESGVVISGMVDQFAPEDLDLKMGDRVLSVEGKQVKNAYDLSKILSRIEKRDWLTVEVARQEQKKRVRVPMFYFPERTQFVVSPDLSDVFSSLDQFGDIVISAPLLNFVESDSELAFLIAHELAHLRNGDFKPALKAPGGGRTTGAKLGAQLGSLVGGIASSGIPRFSQPKDLLRRGGYSLEQEVQADRQAIRYLSHAGYDPSASLEIVERLFVELSSRGSDYVNPVTGAAEISMSLIHPFNEDRIVMLRRHLDELLHASVEPRNPSQPTFADDELLGQISGMEAFLVDESILRMGLAASGFAVKFQTESIEPSLRFMSSEEKIYWFVSYDPLKSMNRTFGRRPVYTVEWYDPKGALFLKEDFKSRIGYHTLASTKLDLSTIDEQDRVGMWRVRVFRDAALMDDRVFKVEHSSTEA